MVKVKKSSNPFQFGTAQKKLLVVFCYYVMLSVVDLTTYTMIARNSPVLRESLQRYFFCEQSGRDSSKPCNRSEFENMTNASGITLSYILLLAVFPVVNLVYIVNIQELKEIWRKYFTLKKPLNSSNTIAVNTMTLTHT